MCIVLISKEGWTKKIIVFGTSDNFENLCYIDYDVESSWATLDTICNIKYSIIKIYNSPSGSCLFDSKDLIYDSQDFETFEYTIDEIAEKLGIKSNQLKIINGI